MPCSVRISTLTRVAASSRKTLVSIYITQTREEPPSWLLLTFASFEVRLSASSVHRSYRHVTICEVLCVNELCGQLSSLIIKYLNSSTLFFHRHDTQLLPLYQRQQNTQSSLPSKVAVQVLELHLFMQPGEYLVSYQNYLKSLFFIPPSPSSCVIINPSKTLINLNCI